MASRGSSLFITSRQCGLLFTMNKINGLFLVLALLIACAPQVYRAQYDGAQIAKERRKRKPSPKIGIIFNDSQLGRLHNNGKKFSDSEFRAHVNKRVPQGLKVRFISGKNLFGKKHIRYAVVYYEISEY